MTGWDDDGQLVQAARRGDTAAFGVLVRRYQDRLYPTLLRLSGSAEDAQDLLQEAFLRAFQKLDRFQGNSAFYTWLYRIAVNLALSQRRRRRPMLQQTLEHDPTRTTTLLDVPTAADPAEPVERAEQNALIQQALDRLAPEQRAVVVMKDLDGLRYEQIAEILNIPIGTVRSRLHRARLELRQRLGSLVEGQPIRGQSD